MTIFDLSFSEGDELRLGARQLPAVHREQVRGHHRPREQAHERHGRSGPEARWRFHVGEV